MDELKKIYLENIANVRALGEHIIKKADTMVSEYQLCDFDIGTFVSDINKIEIINAKVLGAIRDRFEDLESELNKDNEEPETESIKEEEEVKPEIEQKSEPETAETIESKKEDTETKADSYPDEDYEEKMNSLYADDII